MKPQERARALRPFVVKAAESLTNTDALQAIELFDEWAPNVEYPQNKRLRYYEVLFKVRQLHTSSELYPPGSTGSEALYEEVAPEGKGDTPDNPIEYNNNMELFEGKYYSQFEVVYICFRSTGVAVYADLSALVNLYVYVYEVA